MQSSIVQIFSPAINKLRLRKSTSIDVLSNEVITNFVPYEHGWLFFSRPHKVVCFVHIVSNIYTSLTYQVAVVIWINYVSSFICCSRSFVVCFGSVEGKKLRLLTVLCWLCPFNFNLCKLTVSLWNMQMIKRDKFLSVLQDRPHAAIIVVAVIKVFIPNIFKPKASERFYYKIFFCNIRFKSSWAWSFTFGRCVRRLR